MNKKGISPLIITVILVGATILISIAVILWGVDIQKSAIKNQETDTEKLGLVNFDIFYKDSACSSLGENCYRLLLVNNEEFPLVFVIKTVTDSGSHFSKPENYLLNPYSQKVFDVSYPSTLGIENVKADVRAVKA